MILNALEIDPHRLWKGSWRWFSEDLLNCCKDLKLIQKEGITMYEFNCLAKCNGAHSVLKFAENTSIEEFRKDLEPLNTQKDYFLAANFYRGELGQTGSGHFSPIGGYNAKKDLILILDVARYKYAPYWVSVELFYKSMCKVDPDTGHSRGWAVLTKPKNESISLFFQQIQHDITSFNTSVIYFNNQIQKSLKDKDFTQVLNELEKFQIVLFDEKTMEENHKKFIEELYKQAIETKVYSIIFKEKHECSKEKVILLVILCLLSPVSELNSGDYKIGSLLKEEVLFIQQMINSVHCFSCEIKKLNIENKLEN